VTGDARAVTTITIRNMPTPLRRKLEKSAAAAGVSVSDYVVRILKRYDAELRFERKLARLRAALQAGRGRREIRTTS